MKLTGRFNGIFNNQHFFLSNPGVEPGWYYLNANYGDFDSWGGYDLDLEYGYGKGVRKYKLVNSRDYDSFPQKSELDFRYPVYSTDDGRHFHFLYYSNLPDATFNNEFDKFVASELSGL